MIEPEVWTSNPAEQQAIAVLQDLVANLAELLHSVPEARYLDPAGSFDPTS